MSRRNVSPKQAGFTLVELLVVIVLVAIMFASFGTFFTDYITLYSKYQQDGLNSSELALQSQRVTQVMRGLTDITSVGANDMTGYAYFSPVDAYVSTVRYYLNGTSTKLLVDVTPMTSNPPIGTPITAQKKTYTIISRYYQAPGTTLFTYLDASNTPMTLPIADEHSIIDIQVNLSEPASHNTTGQTLSIAVSLRNRKTNL